MSAEDTNPRRCPVCWTWLTPNAPTNPHPRRYCCGACRIEDSRRRRRREREQDQLLRTTRYAEAERRETTRATAPTRRKEPDPMKPD